MKHAGAKRTAGASVFLVTGTQGGFDDREDWTVDAYSTLADADRRLVGLNDLQEELAQAMKITDCEYFDHLPKAVVAAYRERAQDEHFGSDACYDIETIRLNQQVDTAAKP